MTNSNRELTMDDLLYGLERIQREGGWSVAFRNVPGMETHREELEHSENERRRFQGIIHAMTPAERVNTSLLNPSRILRIAQGSGVSPQDVYKALDDFLQLRIEMRKYKDLSWCKRART